MTPQAVYNPAAYAPSMVYQTFQMRSPDMRFDQYAGNAPSLQTVGYKPTQSLTGFKKPARQPGAERAALDSKQDLKEGRTPGAETYETEERVPNSGIYGLEARPAPASRQGYGSEFYGPKKAAIKRPIEPSEEVLAEASPSVVSIFAVFMISFFVGSGVTLAIHRFGLKTSTAAH